MTFFQNRAVTVYFIHLNKQNIPFMNTTYVLPAVNVSHEYLKDTL